MKAPKLITALLIMLSLNATASEPQNTPTPVQDSINLRKGYFLDFSGVMTINDQKVDDYTVYIYQDGVLKDSFFVTNKREQYYELPLNHNFALKFRKEGYRERIILVDTHVPDSESIRYYTFRYSIEFISENDPSNTFDDFPVAYVVFQKSKKDFDYDKKYHRNTRVVNTNKPGNNVSVR
jgi:hypothetical protein